MQYNTLPTAAAVGIHQLFRMSRLFNFELDNVSILVLHSKLDVLIVLDIVWRRSSSFLLTVSVLLLQKILKWIAWLIRSSILL